MRKFSLGTIQTTVLLFSQALTVQVLFYPLIIINIILNSKRISVDKKILFGFFLVFLSGISILVRGGSIELMVILVRFYCGIVLVYAAFVSNKNLKINNSSFLLFILFVFYEYASLMIGVTPFSYRNFINSGIESEIESRFSLGDNVVRAFGPSMNSSVSGSIIAIMFFYIIITSKKLSFLNFRNMFLLFGLFASFVMCGSTTALIVFVILLLVYVLNFRRLPAGNFNLKFFIKLIFVILSFVSFVIILSVIFSDFFDALISAKWNLSYFIELAQYKLLQISVLNSLQSVLFGADLGASTVESAGGDFIILSFVYHFGLIYVIAFFGYLFYICRSENKVFLFVGILSSMHYGTLFSLTGQVFFGALIAGSVCAKEFLPLGQMSKLGPNKVQSF